MTGDDLLDALDILAEREGLGPAVVPLGFVAATFQVAQLAPARVLPCLARHRAGGWGLVPLEDQRLNDNALKQGGTQRVLSAWAIDPDKPSKGHGDNTFWIITQDLGNEPYTTILLPDEY